MLKIPSLQKPALRRESANISAKRDFAHADVPAADPFRACMAARSPDRLQKGAREGESEVLDPGIPKYYFLRKTVKQPGQKNSQPPQQRKMSRSESLPTQPATLRPESAGRLRGTGSAVLRQKPLTLAALAEDLAPISRSAQGLQNEETKAELPPGIAECRSKLEAFRSAAVEAISMEALLHIDKQRKEPAPMPLQPPQDRAPLRGRYQGSSPATAASEGGLPGVDECRRNHVPMQYRFLLESKCRQVASQLIRG
ncbi:hypothetical protein AK812_SmicGene4935 [Symbiodinium microadriaticum]|uniref:Uncharacterized protein n=1 Tax=Symbiodinium microadriaticum TaxID=2951 RepID=A0A1Q9EUY7_SYMMI|nr:hypothetical protein AK812_SmicGene4935 [Symbiodinium microadriaticum]